MTNKSVADIKETDPKILRKYLFDAPNDCNILYKIGQAYLTRNEAGMAISFLCQAVAAEGQNALFYFELGNAFYLGGRYNEAICAFRQALKLDSNMASAYNKLGLAQRASGDLDLAAASIKMATKMSPASAEYWTDLAFTLNEKQEYLPAYKAAKRAAGLQHNGEFRICISESLFGRGKLDAAVAWLKKQIRHDRNWVDGYHNLGRGLAAQGRYKLAQRYYRKAIVLEANHASAHFGLALSLLADGDFVQGWKEYEWRLRQSNHAKSMMGKFISELTEPMWNGEDPKGKTMLVYAEQGFGDCFQLIRYVSVLAKLGCRIILMVYPAVEGLLKGLPDVSIIISYGQLIPRFDFHIALFSLPKMLKADINTVPLKFPYIPVGPGRHSPRRLRQLGKLKVGFIWSTKRLNAFDRRSIPLNYFEILFNERGIDFYSLQIEHGANDIEKYRRRFSNVHSMKTYINDWKDTAYLISKMDLIISIDSAIAHLSGALGKPIWLILNKTAEWRWLSGRKNSLWFSRSPWYPTMRIFRSKSYTKWDVVFDDLHGALLKAAVHGEFFPASDRPRSQMEV
jgi:tetratricopeptide (TPR) repeat protein